MDTIFAVKAYRRDKIGSDFFTGDFYKKEEDCDLKVKEENDRHLQNARDLGYETGVESIYFLNLVFYKAPINVQ